MRVYVAGAWVEQWERARPKNRRTIFTELADQLCATDDDGFAAVLAFR